MTHRLTLQYVETRALVAVTLEVMNMLKLKTGPFQSTTCFDGMFEFIYLRSTFKSIRSVSAEGAEVEFLIK